MNTTLAIFSLLIALAIFIYAVATLIRRTERADVDRQHASTAFNRTWALASILAAVGLTSLLGLRWIWIGLLWGDWLLVGWYCKWFGISILGEKFLHKSLGLWDRNDTLHLRDVLPNEIVTRRLLVFSVGVTAVCAVLVLYIALELDHEANLLQNGITIQATVTNERAPKGTQYEVQYRFSPDDDASWYTFSDATGRTNLWASLTKPDYDTAITSGRVDILFLPQNPWVNRPLRRAPSTPNTGTLIVIGAIVFVCTLFAFDISRKYVFQRLGKQPTISWT